MTSQDEELAVDVDSPSPAPAYLPPTARRVVLAIDGFSEAVGRALSWLVLALVIVVVTEALRRYVLNDPSIWAYDVSYMLYGTIFMLGAAATLRFGGHIRTDLFYQTWPLRRRALVDLTFYVLFLFPGLIVLFWAGMERTVHAFLINERAAASPWRPILWPYRAVIPLCALLVAIQGVSEVIKAVYAVTRGGRAT